MAPPRKGKKPGRTSATALLKAPTPPPVTMQLREAINESDMPSKWGVMHFVFDMALYAHPVVKNFHRYRILKVGIESQPDSHTEFVIRATASPNISDRNKLLCQQDVQISGRFKSKPTRYSMSPVDAVSRGWQDMPESAGQLWTGLHCALSGINSLESDAAGIICIKYIVLELAGLNSYIV